MAKTITATTPTASFGVPIADHAHGNCNNHQLATASRSTFEEELSKYLCKIVDTDHYSHNEANNPSLEQSLPQWGGYSDDIKSS